MDDKTLFTAVKVPLTGALDTTFQVIGSVVIGANPRHSGIGIQSQVHHKYRVHQRQLFNPADKLCRQVLFADQVEKGVFCCAGGDHCV